MITIVYASRAVRPMDETALTELLHAARARNASEGVSGLLLYAYEGFMQQLEGEAGAVDAIYASIQNDRRHTDIRLLSRREIAERRFPDWAMGFEHPDAEAIGERLPGYRTSIQNPLVSPDLVTSSEIAETLLALSAAAPTVNQI
jgi:hypothetical protein